VTKVRTNRGSFADSPYDMGWPPTAHLQRTAAAGSLESAHPGSGKIVNRFGIGRPRQWSHPPRTARAREHGPPAFARSAPARPAVALAKAGVQPTPGSGGARRARHGHTRAPRRARRQWPELCRRPPPDATRNGTTARDSHAPDLSVLLVTIARRHGMQMHVEVQRGSETCTITTAPPRLSGTPRSRA